MIVSTQIAGIHEEKQKMEKLWQERDFLEKLKSNIAMQHKMYLELTSEWETNNKQLQIWAKRRKEYQEGLGVLGISLR